MRFLIETGKDSARSRDWYNEPDKHKQLVMFLLAIGPNYFIEYFEMLVGWDSAPGTLVVKFEDLISGNLTVIQALLRQLDSRCEVNSDDIAAVLAADTLTRSSGVSRWQDYWSDEAASVFEEFRGNELNSELGYRL